MSDTPVMQADGSIMLNGRCVGGIYRKGFGYMFDAPGKRPTWHSSAEEAAHEAGRYLALHTEVPR